MLERVCDFFYFCAVVREGSPFFVFVPVDFFLVGWLFLQLICCFGFFAESFFGKVFAVQVEQSW
jgi:hypothetical protein